MRLGARAEAAVLLWACALLALAGSGCRRAARPDMGGERTVESGVELRFGSASEQAPVATWEFGDGQQATGRQVTHAWARAGTYTVRALVEGEEQGRTQVQVVPRPVLRAMPPQADIAVFIPELRGNVQVLVDFYEQLLGSERAMGLLESTPLAWLVLQSVEEGQGIADPEEGGGFFTLPDFEGTVGVLGVTEGPAAVEALVKEVEGRGVTARREEDGTVYLEQPAGPPWALFVDRGYLYLVVPDSEEARGDEEQGAPESLEARGAQGLARVLAQVREQGGAGLSEDPLLLELREKVGPGAVHVFARGEEAPAEDVRGLWGTLQVAEGRAELEGFIATRLQEQQGQQAPSPVLLERAPAGPVVALGVSLPPQVLTALTFGAPGSERRTRMLQRMQELGVEGEQAAALLESLRGDMGLLAWFDAGAFFRNLVQGRQRPEPRGSLLVEAGLTRAEPMATWLVRWLESTGERVEQVREKDGTTRLRLRLLEQPALISVSADRASLRAGEPLERRPVEDVGRALRERFGQGAFGPGHISLVLDVGRVRAELEAPERVPGVSPAQLEVMRSLAFTLLEQLPPVELLFFDYASEQGGGRFRSRLELRPR
jgi:hypothetical protein